MSHVLSVKLHSSMKRTSGGLANFGILCKELDCEHGSNCRTSGPQATLMKSVSNRLVSNMHTIILLEVILRACAGLFLILLTRADSGPAAGLLPFYGPDQLS